MTAKKIGKRQKPKLSAAHEPLQTADAGNKEGVFEKVLLEGGIFNSGGEHRLTFDDVICKGVSFAGKDLSGAEFVDVVFDHCDFSNVELENAFFQRCEFIQSKLTGTNFSGATLKHMAFDQCEGRYSQFSFTKMLEIDFTDCALPESDFLDCKLQGIRFMQCKLDGINFTDTALDHTDLSASSYDRIEATLSKVAGCVVSSEQALGFAKALGLVINDK